MDGRKQIILDTIIKEHIKTGTPVGSSVLVEKYKLDISPATVRNEMSSLEEDDFIKQPHTSAGRVPTEKAYRYYIDNLNYKKLSKNETSVLDALLAKPTDANLKDAAKEISQITGNAVFWAFHKHNLFYTGISNLFQQPEFSQVELIYDISTVIDRIDDIINNIFSDIEVGVAAHIGSKNPFGNFCGTVTAKYKTAENTGMLGIFGPMRMDYEKNLAIADYVYQKITSLNSK